MIPASERWHGSQDIRRALREPTLRRMKVDVTEGEALDLPTYGPQSSSAARRM